jgi:hypothetical protein
MSAGGGTFSEEKVKSNVEKLARYVNKDEGDEVARCHQIHQHMKG